MRFFDRLDGFMVVGSWRILELWRKIDLHRTVVFNRGRCSSVHAFLLDANCWVSMVEGMYVDVPGAIILVRLYLLY